MSDTFNVLTNTNYLIEILKKSLDEVNKCETGITTRKSKKDGSGEEPQVLHLTHEHFYTIRCPSLSSLAI